MLDQLTVFHFMNQASSESNTLPCKWAHLSHPLPLNDWCSGCFSSSLLFSKLKCPSGFIPNFTVDVMMGFIHLNQLAQAKDPCNIKKSRLHNYSPSHTALFILCPCRNMYFDFSNISFFFFPCLLHSPSPCHLKQAERNILKRQLSCS